LMRLWKKNIIILPVFQQYSKPHDQKKIDINKEHHLHSHTTTMSSQTVLNDRNYNIFDKRDVDESFYGFF
jgi:hypothetical protein